VGLRSPDYTRAANLVVSQMLQASRRPFVRTGERVATCPDFPGRLGLAKRPQPQGAGLARVVRHMAAAVANEANFRCVE
jgi:hypothetical protein